jgi:hypothetical protein
MAAALIFELLCVAGVVFMIRFLIALSGDGRTKSQGHVACLTSWRTETDGDSVRLASAAGAASRSDANSRLWFKVIAGRGERPFRRVG